ncbi:MAG TPA: SDR family NAD(P)-dependent oxidoreductase [Candidatus Binataceae bacterium]|nr:SDR family NAD(P)-dependent oxidoreductase [Candidatus Binataceae bacterium]
MQLLENRVAIISGGTGALGRAVAEYFLESGAKVAIPYVVDAEVPLLKKRVGDRGSDAQLLLKRADVGDESQIAAFVKDVVGKFGKLDILVNLVGGFWGGKSIADTSVAEWQAMLDLNLKPTFLCCRAAIPAMTKNGYGRIVSVTSRSGLTGAGFFAAYAVAKGAIATFTASLAEEVLPDNIIVNAIAPSTIDTEANRVSMPKAKHETWVKPEDIARTVGYLCSENCRVTSGAVVPVYGRA